MADRTLKKGTMWPPIRATLTDADGPLDLTTASAVRFIARSSSILLQGNCTVIGATVGRVEYPIASGDTDNPGTYDVAFKVTWSNGKPETVPNTGARQLIIEADLLP